ncbi:MAG: prolipoprotein diacylglyceryl transferase [Bacteroidales bacterium]|nr:prolipoprotein diacylglyceryl transferase [Bacteroidales bacterium]
MLGYIDWDVDPVFFHLGPLGVRYYSLFFALAFWLGYLIIAKMFKKQGLSEDYADKIFIYTIIGTVVGARLGHVFFYGWEYYSQHLLEIFKVWEGGLASHGGAIGILTALYIYHKKVSKKTYLWVLDHIVIVVALSGFFIRMGNLMNSEIVGQPCNPDLPWAFRFLRLHPDIALIPRHPSQIYEAVFYLGVFLLLSFLYWKKDYIKKEGVIFGLFLVLVFGFRMLVETVKADQEAFESDMVMNMGQLLSIPFVLIGLWCLWRAWNKEHTK